MTDAVHFVRLRTDCAIRVLPHRPCRPVGRYDGCWTILREPQPALCEHGIFSTAEQFLDVRAGIETGKATRDLIDVRHERARILERHAWSTWVRLEVEHE